MKRISSSLGYLTALCTSPPVRPSLLLRCQIALSACRSPVFHCSSAAAIRSTHPPLSTSAPTRTPTHSSTLQTADSQQITPPASVTFLSTSPADTHTLAATLAAVSAPGDVLLLYGAVGEGKTELARGYLRAYTGMSSLIVTSPTYTVMLEYCHAGHRSVSG